MRSPLVLSRHFARIGSLSLWRGAHNDIACATLSSLSASCFALYNIGAVHISILPAQIVTLCALDRFLYFAMLILGKYICLS